MVTDQGRFDVVRKSVTSEPPGYHPGMDDWLTPDEACSALDVGPAQLAGLARAGLLRRTFDRPEAVGRPRYSRNSVANLDYQRAALVDPTVWVTRAEACALLGVSPRAWVDLRREHAVSDNASPVSRWKRYSRAEVAALVDKRKPGVLTRYLTESQAAEKLGTTEAVLRKRAVRNPTRFGFNPRTHRYSAARVGELATS